MGYRHTVLRSIKGAVRSVVHGEIIMWPAVLAGLGAAALSYFIVTVHLNLSVEVALASMTTFLFGVLLAFTIARTRERLTMIRELMARGNSSLQSIHQMVGVFPEPARTRVRALVDTQLTSQIDYRLVDNHLSSPAHDALVEAVYAIVPATSQEEILYKEMVELCAQMSAERALIDTTTGQSLMPVEWIGMLLLLAMIVGLIAVMPGGTVWGALVAGVLTGTLVTLLIVLRQLDRLVWHEQASIWEPTTRLFRSMGLDPYVPRLVIDSGRYIPTGRVRVVDYPDPYPDRTRKVVTVADFGAGPGEAPSDRPGLTRTATATATAASAPKPTTATTVTTATSATHVPASEASTSNTPTG